VETFVYQLCKALVARAHIVRVITGSRGKPPATYREKMDGIDVIRYPERHFFLETPLLTRVIFRLMKEKYDILHVHGMVPTLTELALLVGHLKRKPVVLTYHYDAETLGHGFIGVMANRAYSFLMKVLVPKLADRIVSTSSSYAATSSVLPYCREKLVIIPAGVGAEFLGNPGPMHKRKNGHADSEDENPGSGKRTVLYVGKLQKYKGIENLIAAFDSVRRAIPEARLEIVGDGPQRRQLKALTKRLGLDRYVGFRGWIPQDRLVKTLEESTVFVLPSIRSRREAFGIVVLEAMAAGKPVIVSKIPGPESLVEDGKNGLLVPPGQPKELADAIVRVLQNERLMNAMAEYASQKARNFSWPSITERYQALYRELVSDRSPDYQSQASM